MSECFVYKREVNKSVLWDGFGIDREYVRLFVNQVGEMKRGDSKKVVFILGDKEYPVIIKNLNNDLHRRINDAYQVRYTANGEFAKALQGIFYRSYSYIQKLNKIKENGKRLRTNIPDSDKEYLAIYTTDVPDVYQCETVIADEMIALQESVKDQNERVFEAEFNFDSEDDTAGIQHKSAIVKVRKLNRSIGEELKKLYSYRCQICGCLIGGKYDSHVVEAHHIDYFVKSLNNNASNQLIVCPNHHSIIHDKNPEFNRKTLTYKYPNGYVEGLKLDYHLDKTIYKNNVIEKETVLC